jgi:hypothetical protein
MARARKTGAGETGTEPTGEESGRDGSGGEALEGSALLRFLNEPISAGDMVATLGLGGKEAQGEFETILARRAQAGGMFESLESLSNVLAPSRLAELLATVSRQRAEVEPVEVERTRFRSLLLQNPNYFGNLGVSPFKPVKPFQGNTSYEELVCIGLDPPFDRLEGVVQVKKTTGYGGDICAPGTREYVRFFVDLYDNGVWHDVGLSHVAVHDIPGSKPICYAVRRDFSPYEKFCFFENIVKVRAILQWDVPPPSDPTYVPVWGNVVDAQVQIQPQPFWLFGDLIKELEEIPVKIPDPIGPVIEALDPATVLPLAESQPLSLHEKKALYAKADVPLHRFAFQEATQLLALADPNAFATAGQSPLAELGLSVGEIGNLVGKLFPTDGDTSFEELRCVGLYPEANLIEAVLTVKKPSGYSGSLCGSGSTEYVAFWIDFNDGNGFQYMGTPTVSVHDLQTIPAEGIQYAVWIKKNLSKYRVPCEAGPRIARLRAILSWETPPPPGDPKYVPVWGNREECRVQLKPGKVVGHIPLIETVGDIAVPDINQATGLATGSAHIGSFSVLDSPFGGEVTITGEIGAPPDAFNGGPPDSFSGGFKYRIDVFGPPPFNSWQPLTNVITVDVATWFLGNPIQCPLQPPNTFLCKVALTPTDDGDGHGPGWYEYLEDDTGLFTRHLVLDTLARWQTNVAMEGLWQIRITAKNSLGILLPGIQTVTVRIDNTAPSGPAGPGATPAQIEANPPLEITGATFNGQNIPATDCGKFPVGTILSGTYEVHDPGLTSPSQHFGGLTLDVIPDGPANGAAPVPSSRSYPVVSTNGEAGTWTLDTAPMDACGYVIRLAASDRTNYDSRGNPLTMTYDVGFCLVSEGEG